MKLLPLILIPLLITINGAPSSFSSSKNLPPTSENKTSIVENLANNTRSMPRPKEERECEFDGIPLYGKVKFVESFPDIKIKFVESFPDIKVKFVSSFPDDCGKWEIVESFPDFTVKVVESFPDIKVKPVESFPGMN